MCEYINEACKMLIHLPVLTKQKDNLEDVQKVMQPILPVPVNLIYIGDTLDCVGELFENVYPASMGLHKYFVVSLLNVELADYLKRNELGRNCWVMVAPMQDGDFDIPLVDGHYVKAMEIRGVLIKPEFYIDSVGCEISSLKIGPNYTSSQSENLRRF